MAATVIVSHRSYKIAFSKMAFPPQLESDNKLGCKDKGCRRWSFHIDQSDGRFTRENRTKRTEEAEETEERNLTNLSPLRSE